MEVLDRPVRIALPVKPDHPRNFSGADPMRAWLAKPPIGKPVFSPGPIPASHPTKRPLAHSQGLRRLRIAQPPSPAPLINLQEPHLPKFSQKLCPTHHRPLFRSDSQIGQITCYKNRTDDVLPTAAVAVLVTAK